MSCRATVPVVVAKLYNGGKIRAGALVGAVAAALALPACGSHSGAARPQATTTAPTRPAGGLGPSPTAPPGTACTNTSVVAGWSPQRRVAQLVVAPVYGFDPATMNEAAADGVGGVLFLGSAAPPSGLATEISAARAMAPAGVGAPMFMADQEGGGVQRLAGAVPSMPWARTVAATMTPAQAQAAARNVAAQMHRLGVGVDLAPVLDVDGGSGPDNRDADGARSYSASVATVSRYGVAVMNGFDAGGVLSVVKHFPGLGGATANTDVAPATTPPLSTLEKVGLVPFRAAIDAGARAVMVSNASVPGLTALPASLSAGVITGLLRGQLGFKGLVMTDSLSAQAIRAAGYSPAAAAVKAVEAGADMILFGGASASTSAAGIQAGITGIETGLDAALASGELPAGRLDNAVTHVLAAKGIDLCSAAGS